MNPIETNSAGRPGAGRKSAFSKDFRWFFLGGLKALLPTLVTLWLLLWVWSFLWEGIGRHLIWAIKWLWVTLNDYEMLPQRLYEPPGRIRQILSEESLGVRFLGVGLAIIIVYIVGVFVGNLIGRTMWRLVERNVMRLPLIRAIYPSVKQVTDFLLADRASAGGPFPGSRVVAVQARHQGVWSIGLVTGAGYGPLNSAIRGDMVTVFIPSSPTAVAGYVVVAHRDQVVDLPLTVEEAMRLLISGGVLVPGASALPPRSVGGPVAVAPAVVGSPLPPGVPPAISPPPADAGGSQTSAA